MQGDIWKTQVCGVTMLVAVLFARLAFFLSRGGSLVHSSNRSSIFINCISQYPMSTVTENKKNCGSTAETEQTTMMVDG